MAHARNRNRARREKKKGIVLLIIVTLLTLFIMIGITLTLLATNYKDASEKVRSAGTYGDLAQREAELALDQVLFGNSVVTALSPHNLLADYYGVDGVAGTVTAYTEENQNQVLRITYSESPAGQQPFGQAFSPIPHYYAGRVITFTDGTAAGFSTRVMAYLPTSGNATTGTLFVEAIESDLPVKVVPSSGSRFLINGAPFNGTGFGYYPGTYNIDMDENGQDATMTNQARVALLGNFSTLASTVPFAGGGPDESWDAPDLGNWHLAVIPPVNADGIPGNDVPTIPSFHRPELINYWLYQINSMGGNINQIPLSRLRQLSLRPIGAEYGNNADHVNFNGSNPNYHPINGPWDVDNNGDGIPDSIWVDPRLPMVTTRDGRKYKRLVAFLIQDLDGRINLNVHGNLSQLQAQSRGEQGTASLGLYPGGTTLTRGVGYGPSEVDFLSVFGNFTNATDLAAYSNLLTGRYGTDGQPGTSGTRDGFNIVKHHGTPNDYANQVSWYSSPPDVWGRGAMAIDSSGNPLTLYMGQAGEMLDNPYEIHAGQHALAADAPYTLADLESLLRYHDPSARDLRTRFINNATSNYLASSSPGSLGLDYYRRELFTTLGSYSPVAMTRVPREFFSDSTQQAKPGYANAVSYIQDKHNPTLLDLFTYKLIREGGVTNQNDPLLPTHINSMAAWEIRHGQLLDINRFLGDGFDNNGDGVVDDYNEAGSGTEQAWLANPQVPQTFQGTTAWHTNDVDMTGDVVYNGNDFIHARQLFARHLFCLMMALVDDGYDQPAPQEPSLNVANRRELVVRRIAQWAINVVDFRDSDAVMTPFEYDVNPFNGWQVDGNLGTDGNVSPEMIVVNGSLTSVNTAERRVVWGVEQPDLVLTESFAMHDRRTRDTRYDTSMRDVDGMDMHADQLRLPQGSLFVELYCPRASYTNNPRLPQELYAQFAPGQWRLNLQKLVPASGDGVQRPVWRLAISDHTGPNAAPTTVQEAPWTRQTSNPDSTSFEPANMSLLPPTGPIPQLPIDRYVWFSSIDPPVAATTEYGRTYVNSLGWDVSLEPGQYAVVGPRIATYMGSATDGDPTTIHDGDSPQGIQLSQRTMMNPNGVTVTGINGMQTYTPGTQIKNAVGIVCDMATDPSWTNQARRIGLNVTEPLPLINGFYYGEPTFANDAYDDLNAPTNVLPDEPFDRRAGYPLQQWGMVPTDTYENVRAIFLQRLANPNAAWDPIYNPYITIDWSSADATVFTGEDTPNVPTPMGNSRDPDDPMPSPANPLRFGTRQKGIDYAQLPNVNVNLWTNFWPQPQVTAASMLGTTFFDYDLVDSLAYLNTNLGTPQPDNMGTPTIELGDPAEGPFPWLGHLDRPFMNAMELMMVPAWSAARLNQEFQPMTQPGFPRAFNNYDMTTMAFPPYAPPFTQLLNFYQTGSPTGALKISPQFTRLLDYVEVPSPYSGTEKWYNSQVFGAGTPPNSGTAADTFRPPFNKLSRFRDPGRININTIFDDAVLAAALGQLPYPGNAAANQNFRQQVILSRQGYGANAAAIMGMDPRYPTRFANPFRTADSADLMPDIPNMRKAPAEATFLRSDTRDTTTPAPTPLFQVPSGPSNNPYNDVHRHSYFYFQDNQRIGNLFSTQSNVFAVWVTVGYFEVEEVPNYATMTAAQKAPWPDGYRLAQEVGSDSGSVVRHRSFFIIDRTIPAAYEPGKRHNTDKTVLLRRFIE